MATGISYFGRTETANVPLLNKKLQREAWYKTFWGRFAKTTTPPEKRPSLNAMPAPVDSIVTVHRDFVQEGRDSIIIPMLSRISDDAKYGDSQLTGFVSKMSIKYLTAYINQVRQGVSAQGGRMSNLRVKAFQMMNNARPLLSDWFADWNNTYGLTHAMYYGFSENITGATTRGGYGFTAANGVSSHPHIFTSVSSEATKVSGTPATSAYENAVGTAVNGLTATSGDYMSASLLESLKVKVMELKISQIMTKNGKKFWLLVLHPNQVRQLRADSDWVAANSRAFVDGMAKENPIFSGAAGEYAGFVIFEDINIVKGAVTSGSDPNITVQWGSTSWMDTITDSSKKFGMVLGKNALARGIGFDLYYTTEVYDHENTKEVGGAMIVGDRRADFDIDGTVYNDSSCLIGTYSP